MYLSKRRILLLLFLVAVFFLFSSTANAVIRIVGCLDQEYKTIQAAVDASNGTGDSIHVKACGSPYSENVIINGKDLAIGTDGKDVVELVAPTAGTGIGFKILNITGFCRIYGFTIKDFAYGVQGLTSVNLFLGDNDYFGSTNSGIYFSNVDNSTIDGQEIKDGARGIYFTNDSDGNKISDISIHGNSMFGIGFYAGSDNNNVDPGDVTTNVGDGIHLDNSSGNTFTDYPVTNSGGNGVYLLSSNANTFDNCPVDNSGGYGIYLNNSDNNTFTDCPATNNGKQGIYVTTGSDGNSFSGSPLSYNVGDGIYVDNSDNNSFTGYIICYNTGNGFKLVNGSDNNTFNGNTIYKNDLWGGYVSAGCLLNVIHCNCFYNNNENNPAAHTSQGFDASGSWHWDDHGTPVGNYWNDFIAPAPYLLDGGSGIQDRGPKTGKLMVLPAYPPGTVIPIGETRNVNVDLDLSAVCAPAQHLFAYEIRLIFPSAKIDVVDVSHGDFPGSGTDSTFFSWVVRAGTTWDTLIVTESCLGETSHVVLDSLKLFDIVFEGLNYTWSEVKLDSWVIKDHPQKHHVSVSGYNSWVKVIDVTCPYLVNVDPPSGGTINAPITFTDLTFADDGRGIKHLGWDVDGGTWYNDADVGGCPSSHDFATRADAILAWAWGSLGDGAHFLTFTVDDCESPPNAACDTVVWNFTKDTTAPSFDSIVVLDTGSPYPAQPGFTNDTSVFVDIYGAADAVEYQIRYNAEAWSVWFALPGGGPPWQVTWYVRPPDSPANTADKMIKVKLRDVYGNVTTSAKTDYIILDQTAPVFTDWEMADKTSASFDYTDESQVQVDWHVGYAELHPYERYYDEVGGAVTNQMWADPWLYTFTSAGEGLKIVLERFVDKAGNASAWLPDSIVYDATPPTGYIVMKDRTTGDTYWTNEQYVDVDVFPQHTDAWRYWLREPGGTQIGPMLLSSPVTYDDFNLNLSSAEGWKKMEVYFQDSSGLVSGWIGLDSILYDKTKPSCPTSSFASVPAKINDGPGVHLTWDYTGSDPHFKGVIIKKERWNNYPWYGGGAPSCPGDFLVDSVEAPVTSYNTAEPCDIYVFSITFYDSAGNESGCYLCDMTTSYILGDFDCDGDVDWDDLLRLAYCYNTCAPDPNFDPYCDIGPTDDGTQNGLPQPDGCIDFQPDLMIFAQNYGKDPMYPKVVPVVATTTLAELTVEMAGVAVGEEFDAKLVINHAEGVQGIHVALDYDDAQLQLLKIDRGEVLSGSDIFYWSAKDRIDFSAAALGLGATIEASGEVVTIHFKLLQSGDIELTSKTLDLRDTKGGEVNCSFNKVGFKALPTTFTLAQNYPNPFNLGTNICFALPVDSKVDLRIYNITGQLVKILISDQLTAGHHTMHWDGTNSSGITVSSGIYLYKLTAGEFTSTRKMVIMK